MRRSPLVCCAVAALAGCGDDGGGERAGKRVAVPDRDATPPHARITLDGSDALATVLERRGLRARIEGRDDDSGVARVRIAISELITCAGGRALPRRRYFPPSQIERIRSSPGARIPAAESETRRLRIGAACARPVAVRGELWGDVTNGLGLEAVTPHIRFTWSSADR